MLAPRPTKGSKSTAPIRASSSPSSVPNFSIVFSKSLRASGFSPKKKPCSRYSSTLASRNVSKSLTDISPEIALANSSDTVFLFSVKSSQAPIGSCLSRYLSSQLITEPAVVSAVLTCIASVIFSTVIWYFIDARFSALVK